MRRSGRHLMLTPVAAIVAAALALTLAGCSLMGPRQDLGDLIDTTDALVATAEADLPAIAAALDAKVDNATVMHTSQGTNMGGSELNGFISVAVEMSGPPATQADLDQVLTDMGYSDVTGSQFPDHPNEPDSSAISTDGKFRISLDYGVFARGTANERTGFNVYFSPVKPVNLKESEFNTYVDDYHWTVDVAGINARR